MSEEKLVKGREEDGRQMMMKGEEENFEDGEKKEWKEKSFEIGFVSDISSRTFCISLSPSPHNIFYPFHFPLSLSLFYPSFSLSLALFLVHPMERKDGKSIFI